MSRATLIPAVVLTAALAGCAASPDRPDAAGAVWPGWATPTGSAPITSTPRPSTTPSMTGHSTPGVAAQSGGVTGAASIPTAPRLTVKATDFSSPEAVAAQYLSVWCFLPAGAGANANIGRSAPWLTPAGMREDHSRAVSSQTWVTLQAQHISTVCGAVAATVTPRPTDSARRRCVEIWAVRYQLQNGQVVDTDSLLQVRTVLRDADGRWRIDRQERAG